MLLVVDDIEAVDVLVGSTVAELVGIKLAVEIDEGVALNELETEGKDVLLLVDATI